MSAAKVNACVRYQRLQIETGPDHVVKFWKPLSPFNAIFMNHTVTLGDTIISRASSVIDWREIQPHSSNPSCKQPVTCGCVVLRLLLYRDSRGVHSAFSRSSRRPSASVAFYVNALRPFDSIQCQHLLTQFSITCPLQLQSMPSPSPGPRLHNFDLALVPNCHYSLYLKSPGVVILIYDSSGVDADHDRQRQVSFLTTLAHARQHFGPC